MITRYCEKCKAYTPFNKAENRKDSPYICEECGSELNAQEIGRKNK